MIVALSFVKLTGQDGLHLYLQSGSLCVCNNCRRFMQASASVFQARFLRIPQTLKARRFLPKRINKSFEVTKQGRRCLSRARGQGVNPSQ